EAVLLALGGKLTRPDGTFYDYSKNEKKFHMNAEGFIATVFGDEYHSTFLKQNIIIEELDLILFGATGFTGKLACEYIIERYYNSDYKFGFAARDMKKLNQVKEYLLNKFNSNEYKNFINNIKLFKCDALNINDCESLVSKCSCIITTVGPYMRYGT